MNWKAATARQIIRASQRVLPRLDQAPMKLASAADVIGFLSTLHPITTEHPLVRIGPDGDGGYLVPDDLDGIEACFSPGVGPISAFEADCAGRGMEVFLADASVEGPAQDHERFHFVPRFVGSYDDDLMITMDRWVGDALPSTSTDLLLQMDIEGGEYDVVPSMSDELLARFRVIVVEFHSLDALLLKSTFGVLKRPFERLLRTHACVHIHPNNYFPSVSYGGIELPPVAEFTFHRRDRVHPNGFATTFPHPLDRDNMAKASVKLPPSLFRSCS